MTHHYAMLPQGPAMPPPLAVPNSSTPRDPAAGAPGAVSPPDADDFAIGCECADPSLQIEGWVHEATAQPLHEFY